MQVGGTVLFAFGFKKDIQLPVGPASVILWFAAFHERNWKFTKSSTWPLQRSLDSSDRNKTSRTQIAYTDAVLFVWFFAKIKETCNM